MALENKEATVEPDALSEVYDSLEESEKQAGLENLTQVIHYAMRALTVASLVNSEVQASILKEVQEQHATLKGIEDKLGRIADAIGRSTPRTPGY